MRVLVTGGAGYIGSHAAKALAIAGHLPVVFDNLSQGHKWAVRWGPLLIGDLGDPARLLEALRQHRIDAVMHFAARAYVQESMLSPGLYFENNCSNSVRLLDSMQKAGVRRIVFSSTCATYGTPQRIPIDESHTQAPVNPYGESKLFVERVLRWYGEIHGMAWVALRYFNAAGADPDAEIGECHVPEPHLIPRVLEATLSPAKPLFLFGTDYPTQDGTAIRDYVHVSDLAVAHVRALHYLEDGGASGAFNLGAGRGHSVRQVIDAAARITGRRPLVRESPRRPGDPPELVADATRAQRLLGWTPARSHLDGILETAWNWQARANSRARTEAVSA